MFIELEKQEDGSYAKPKRRKPVCVICDDPMSDKHKATNKKLIQRCAEMASKLSVATEIAHDNIRAFGAVFRRSKE